MEPERVRAPAERVRVSRSVRDGELEAERVRVSKSVRVGELEAERVIDGGELRERARPQTPGGQPGLFPTLCTSNVGHAAYDSVSWSFLDYMLRRFGFDAKWRSWVKACVFAGSLSVLVNGSPTEQIDISKGLKQGDPLAPFLFILVAEGLGALMKKAVELGFFKGIQFPNEGANISHLQYADDTLFVGEACVENLWTIKAILRWFELISGLKVNFFKSKLFGINVEDDFLSSATSFLKCNIGRLPFIYLGLPVGANPRRLSTWNPVLEVLKEDLPLGRINMLA
ncbi:cytochrome p450 [Trifolium pratense]|uniref:Cytochrome p450 n=1 Tax=Trifolium pratense TaxID=57577 RepID=A0A2K3N200_TRIPR|nr:cytochrome p450 [Trifolium pratense]